jgi:glycosyltransferase involved in cell wall biosynthesis
MVAMYKEYGIFLNPTRWDSQGVSRDEAMSSGLVPITNNVAAIPEFANDNCAIISEAEDYIGMAKGVARLYNEPKLFLAMSREARKRVENQSSKKYTIQKELELMITFGRQNESV